MEILSEEKRSAMEAEAARAMSKARVAMLMNKDNTSGMVFFSSCVMNLAPRPLWEIPTAATDGEHVFYNPQYWLDLGDEKRVGVLCHEVLHCTNKHMSRRGDRNHELWNYACDFAINPIVRNAGLKLPDKCMWPTDFNLPELKSAEWYYSNLPVKCQQWQMNGDGPEGCGDVQDASGQEAGKRAADDKWSRISQSAAEAAKKRGELPNGLRESVEKYGKPKLDYWHILREFMSDRARDDSTWARPSRRSVDAGIYLPAQYSEKLGKIVVAVDCSGSCWEGPILKRFAAEIDGMRDLMPSEVMVLYHDSKLQGEPVIFENGDPLVIEARGGGGTSHRQVFNWIDQNVEDAECVICLTDMFTEFGNPPGLPVLWLTIESGIVPPFGTVIDLEV